MVSKNWGRQKTPVVKEVKEDKKENIITKEKIIRGD